MTKVVAIYNQNDESQSKFDKGDKISAKCFIRLNYSLFIMNNNLQIKAERVEPAVWAIRLNNR